MLREKEAAKRICIESLPSSSQVRQNQTLSFSLSLCLSLLLTDATTTTIYQVMSGREFALQRRSESEIQDRSATARLEARMKKKGDHWCM
jgi:hypothetical protein